MALAALGRWQMAARTKSYVTPKFKTKYKVKNWPAYEATEARIAVSVLNRMSGLGMPDSEAVAS